jgi:hypothetical protein
MDELSRYGTSYWQCRTCEYGSMIRSSVEAHLRDHEPRPTLDELLAARAAPEEAPAPAPTPTRRRRK